MTSKLFCVGIDLCSDFSQVAYFSYKDKEPVEVEVSEFEQKYMMPTVVGKISSRDEWLAGADVLKYSQTEEVILVEGILEKAISETEVAVDDIMIKPIELIKIYLDYLLQIARKAGNSNTIDKICITVEDFNISVLNVIAKALEELGIDRRYFEIISHGESFIFYTISQRPDIYRGDVILFDYGPNGLKVKRMFIANNKGTKIIMIHTDDFSDEVSYDLATDTEYRELLDERLKEIAEKIITANKVVTVFLTGSGFGEEMELENFLKYICNRKRVFIGQNLYVNGACYSASQGLLINSIKDYLIACEHRITTGIELKISDRGRDKILRMVRPGINWFSANCSYDFIVDDVNEMGIFLSPVTEREKRVIKISLDEFPIRPNKTTRITLSLSFTDDAKCNVAIKDCGFGEFYPGSGLIINKELIL